jgi:hypothetical protein
VYSISGLFLDLGWRFCFSAFKKKVDFGSMELWRSKMSSEHVGFVRVIFSFGSEVQSITFEKNISEVYGQVL